MRILTYTEFVRVANRNLRKSAITFVCSGIDCSRCPFGPEHDTCGDMDTYILAKQNMELELLESI